MRRRADNFVDYQARAKEFSVGDVVAPFGMLDSQSGRVTAVWPGIGMVDVEMQTGNKRYPVEDLLRFEDGNGIPTFQDSVAGGAPTVPVSGGPSALRVASAYMAGRVYDSFVGKQALYWASCDRKYKMNRAEAAMGRPCCPKCGPSAPLSRASYKRRGGASEKLWGCKNCLFLIKQDDILNLNSAPVVELELEGEEII